MFLDSQFSWGRGQALPTPLIAHQRLHCDNPLPPHRNVCLARVCKCLVTFTNSEGLSLSLVCSSQLNCSWISSNFTFLLALRSSPSYLQ